MDVEALQRDVRLRPLETITDLTSLGHSKLFLTLALEQALLLSLVQPALSRDEELGFVLAQVVLVLFWRLVIFEYRAEA